MIAVIQRVTNAKVETGGSVAASSGAGLLVLLGVAREDEKKDAELLAAKLSGLRIFEDENEKMNLSVNDIGGTVTVVPNFTLMASYKKGNRPDFFRGAPPEEANALFEYFCEILKEQIPLLQRGVFRADMQVSLTNDGPVTIVMDSRVLRGEHDI